MLVCFAMATAFPALYWLYITWENNKRAKRLAASTESNIHVENEEFLDLTDKEQRHFVYIK
jgi:MFS transporter, ACS family, allantoate permease